MTVEYAPAGQLEGNNTPMQEPAYQGMLDLLATTKPKSKTGGLNYTQKSKSFFKKKTFLVVSTVKERYILNGWLFCGYSLYGQTTQSRQISRRQMQLKVNSKYKKQKQNKG